MTTTLQFLNALYPDPVAPGELVVWTRSKRGGKKYSYWLNTLGEAADHGHRVKTSRDVYFGVALHDPIRARTIVRRRWPKVQLPSVRGSHDSAVALPAIWANIEVAGPGQACTNLPPDRASAFKLFDAVAKPPSIIVDTGSGYQVYWLFRDLWTLANAEERLRARDLLCRLQGALRAAALLEGWSIDADAGLAEALRLPGTLNLTSPKARAVKVIHFPLDPKAAEVRYTPADFDDLPPAPEPATVIRRRGHQRAGRPRPPAEHPSGATAGGQLARFEPMVEGCRFLQDCYAMQDRVDGRRLLVALGLVGRAHSEGLDSAGLAHDLSKGHPGYHPLKTEEMLEHAVRDLEPSTCVEIEDEFDADGRLCGRCPNRGKIKNPLPLGQLGRCRSVAPFERAPARVSGRVVPGVACSGPASAAGVGDGGTPEPVEIVVTPREHEVNDLAMAALAAREPSLYERAGVLVQVLRPRAGAVASGAAASGSMIVRPVQEALLSELLTRHCIFVKPKKLRLPPGEAHEQGYVMRRVHPPRWCARALLARGSWPELPYLDAPDPAESRGQLAGAGAEQATVDDLVHGLGELLQPLGGSATAREILDKLARSGSGFPRLRSAFDQLFPRLENGELPRSTQLAGRLRCHRGRIAGGACIDQASKSHRGVNWTVRRVA